MNERITLGGTDGHRGLAQLDTDQPGLINENTFRLLTAAHVSVLQDGGESGVVVIGQDTRPSSDRLRKAAIEGARSQGAEVLDMQIVPTPLAQKVAETIGAMATVVVTASHNKYTENGWKGMAGSDKLDKRQFNALSDRFWELQESGISVPKIRHHTVIPERDVHVHRYAEAVISDIQEQFKAERPLEGKIIAVDGAYGAGRQSTWPILKRLGADIVEFATGNDGLINDNSGAANLAGIRAFLLDRPGLMADPNFLGAVSNDGDADRVVALGVVQQNGKPTLVEVNGNHIMWAMAQGEPGIVGTEYTNTGLVNNLHANGIDFEQCANGDINVTTALRDRQRSNHPWTRGGEFTGHFVDTNWLSSGDGVRAAAWFSAWAVTNNMSFGDVHQNLPLWHEKMHSIALTENNGSDIAQSGALREAIDKLEGHIGSKNIRFILRASGTEPVFRVWGEGKNPTQTDAATKRLANVVNDLANNAATKQ